MQGYSHISEPAKLDELWGKHDADGNGFLDRDEAKPFLEDVKGLMSEEKAAFYNTNTFDVQFTKFDEDKNGFLEKSEMGVLIKKVF